MILLGLGTFQFILFVLALLLSVASAVAVLTHWTGRREGLTWLLIWVAAGVAALRPDFTSRIAHVLGIGRGADLVFYCAVVVMLIGFWMMYTRLRRVRREITLLVRHLAIAEAERGIEERDGGAKGRGDGVTKSQSDGA